MDIDLGTLATQISDVVTAWGLRVIGAIAVLMVGWFLARKLRQVVSRGIERSGVDESLIPFLAGLTYWMAMAFVVIAVLGLFGVPTASFVAVLGALGLAIGLALQGTLGHFASGVMLLVFRPFKAGDLVQTAGEEGRVREIGIFYTALDARDNVQVIVPNGEVFSQVIRNLNGNDVRRCDMVVGVDYSDDLKVARETIERVLRDTPGVLEDPAPTVELHELGDSSVNFVVRPWCASDEVLKVRWGFMRRIKPAIEEAGCSFPFPQRDIHFFNETEGGNSADAAAASA